MKRILVALCGAFGLVLVAGCAETTPEGARPVTPVPAASAHARLDDLFARLRTTANEEEAETIEQAILRAWASSGRPEADALLLQGVEEAEGGDLAAAEATLGQALAAAPDFAEGYNQRALVRVERGAYSDAIADMGRVLALEPRHFGTLTELGRVFLLFDRDRAALSCFDAALAVNPHLDHVREEADSLRRRLAGEPA